MFLNGICDFISALCCLLLITVWYPFLALEESLAVCVSNLPGTFLVLPSLVISIIWNMYVHLAPAVRCCCMILLYVQYMMHTQTNVYNIHHIHSLFFWLAEFEFCFTSHSLCWHLLKLNFIRCFFSGFFREKHLLERLRRRCVMPPLDTSRKTALGSLHQAQSTAPTTMSPGLKMCPKWTEKRKFKLQAASLCKPPKRIKRPSICLFDFLWLSLTFFDFQANGVLGKFLY